MRAVCWPVRSFRTQKINIVPSHCLHINIFQMVRDNARERCRTITAHHITTAVDGVSSLLFCLRSCVALSLRCLSSNYSLYFISYFLFLILFLSAILLLFLLLMYFFLLWLPATAHGAPLTQHTPIQI